MEILIIEDEARTARELAAIITAVDPALKVTATLESVEQTVDWLNSNPHPGLIFSDIQLADGLSFEIFEKIAVGCPIIFCSAFDEYLVDAFETNAISYLLKPITREKVSKALNKLALLKKAFEAQNTSIKDLLKQLRQPYKTTILVSKGDNIIPVPTHDIACLYMKNTIVEVFTFQNHKYFITNSLDELDTTLDKALFFRANRQFIINRKAVESIQRFFSRKLAVRLTFETPEVILVSKARATEFLNWLENSQ